ncbi:nicotinate phosphoribosyltransferase [Armatimonas sp.]|uniref:nicotinate phosphoribosyltransferase n=1 Tax=Armatimonas sp. TaxID=1872638 RepID=UPI00286D5296|nr:nicotinate phosphoribosyltransferase [Armatimonas sp.]
MIASLLDTDLYKFTMMQVVWGRYPQAQAEYKFQCRSTDTDLTPFATKIRAELDKLAGLRLQPDEAVFLRSIRYIRPEFVDFLESFRLDPSLIEIYTKDGFELRIRGPWLASILFEVPVLATINEIWSRHHFPLTTERETEGLRRLEGKIQQLSSASVPVRVMEFGTRRRYSQAWQERVVEQLAPHLIGTSNVHLAHKFGLKPFGTMAHEFLQAGQALAPLLNSQRFMLEEWMQFYRGDLGIALSDVFGFDAFLNDFDRLFAKAYDGCRHDSGDPAVWGEKLLAHYESLGVDPRHKTAVFSDGLSIPKAIALAERFDTRIRTIFGIGTDLTNDLGEKALQIVLKLVRLNNQPVVKLSDSPGKAMTDDAGYLEYVRATFAAGVRRNS